jgi:hypothetical protein
MSAVTETVEQTELVGSDRPPVGVPAELVEALLEQVKSQGLELLGEGGVLAGLTKTILERALDEELECPRLPGRCGLGGSDHATLRVGCPAQ